MLQLYWMRLHMDRLIFNEKQTRLPPSIRNCGSTPEAVNAKYSRQARSQQGMEFAQAAR